MKSFKIIEFLIFTNYIIHTNDIDSFFKFFFVTRAATVPSFDQTVSKYNFSVVRLKCDMFILRPFDRLHVPYTEEQKLFHKMSILAFK